MGKKVLLGVGTGILSAILTGNGNATLNNSGDSIISKKGEYTWNYEKRELSLEEILNKDMLHKENIPELNKIKEEKDYFKGIEIEKEFYVDQTENYLIVTLKVEEKDFCYMFFKKNPQGVYEVKKTFFDEELDGSFDSIAPDSEMKLPDKYTN